MEKDAREVYKERKGNRKEERKTKSERERGGEGAENTAQMNLRRDAFVSVKYIPVVYL